MEIRTLKLYHTPHSPFTGSGLCVVLERSEDSAHVMHTATFADWKMPLETVHDGKDVKAEGLNQSTTEADLLWPENKSSHNFEAGIFVSNTLKRAQKMAAEGKRFNVTLVSRVLAALSGRPSEEFIGEIGELKTEETMAARKTKKGKKEPKEKAPKKGAAPKDAAAPKEKASSRAGRIYRLAANTESKGTKEGSHKYAAIKALEKIKEGTTAQITEVAVKNKFIGESKMDPGKAIGWILGQLARDKKVLYKD